MWAGTTKKHSHGPTYRANTATLHGRAMDSMSRGGRERGMHHTLPSNKYINLFRNDQVLGEIRLLCGQAQQKKHSHGPTYRANTATLHRRAVDSMSRGGGERGMHHTMPATSTAKKRDWQEHCCIYYHRSGVRCRLPLPCNNVAEAWLL